jgi:hypothetical protein
VITVVHLRLDKGNNTLVGFSTQLLYCNFGPLNAAARLIYCLKSPTT